MSADTSKSAEHGAGGGAFLQRFEGLISAALYVFTSLMMTSATKYAASVWRFPGSSFLLLVECIATAAYMVAVAPRGQYQPFAGRVLKHVPLVTIAKAVNMYLSFFAMRLVSLPVYNVLKRLQPIYALIQDRLIRGARTTFEEQVAVLLISIGTVITGFGDLDFNLFGYAIAIVAAGSQSLYLVLARHASDSTEGGLSHVDLLFYTAFYNIVLFGPLAATEMGEVRTFLAQPGEPMRLLYFLIPYVILGALLNFATYWCTSANSPLATAVAGSLKGVLSTAVGVIFFGARLTAVGWIGFGLSALGGWAYSDAQKKKKQQQQAAKRD